MYLLQQPNRNKTYNQRLSYRYYTRQVMSQPMNKDIHTSRIIAAMELSEREPLQGAIADMFYGCWFDVPFFGERILSQVKDKLHQQTLKGFQACVEKTNYIRAVSPLATRWSVLVSPSMDMYDHQLRASADDARALASQTIHALLEVKNTEDEQYQLNKTSEIENEFFSHCTACNDRLAFSIVWWQLAKNNWEFDNRWTACRLRLEEKL